MPPLKDNENFKYLGRYFNFNIHNQKHKKYLLENTNTTLNNIDKLPLHPNNKLNLYNKYFLSNLLWYLTIADITEICVQEKPDSLCHKKLRSQLATPINRTLDTVQSKLSLNIIDITAKNVEC